MPYCVTADITSNFGDIEFSATSKVTTTDITNLIDSESNYIDSYLYSKYIVPVLIGTAPLAYALLKRICIFRVSERVRGILQIKSGETQLDQDTKAPLVNPDADLKKIIDGKLSLMDATYRTTEDGLSFGVPDITLYPFDPAKQQW